MFGEDVHYHVDAVQSMVHRGHTSRQSNVSRFVLQAEYVDFPRLTACLLFDPV